MKIIPAAKLVEVVAAIMRAGGCGGAEAHTVARRLVDSNLVGHDSHGVIRVGKYLEWVRAGWLVPNGTPTVVFENDAIAIVDGDRGFGQVVGEFAGELGTRKAARTGIAMVGLRNCGHLGRVGDWAELAAAKGQVSLHFLNTSGAQRVAPFGGSDRRLSTNPITIGIPIADSDPVILDVTTSSVAEGKLFVAINKGEHVPPGWIIDKHGQPTTDPKDFYDGGALLTVGAHKGSGLSIVVDLLAGALSTGKSSDPGDTVLRNNMLSIYIAPAVYDREWRNRRRDRALRGVGQGLAPGGPRAACADARRNRAQDAGEASGRGHRHRRQDLGRHAGRGALGWHRSGRDRFDRRMIVPKPDCRRRPRRLW